MSKYQIEIYKNEELDFSTEVEMDSENLLQHQMIPEMPVQVNKFGEVTEVVSTVLLKESDTNVYRSGDKYIYFHPFSGQEFSLDVDLDILSGPVGTYSPWVKGNLDVTTYKITPIDN